MTLARIRKGDNVVVISGKDKGKTGKVKAVDPKRAVVVIEGINLQKRHTRPTQTQREGGIIEREFPVAMTKVMPVDPETGRGTRVRTRVEEDGSKTRLAKSGKAIEAETN